MLQLIRSTCKIFYSQIKNLSSNPMYTKRQINILDDDKESFTIKWTTSIQFKYYHILISIYEYKYKYVTLCDSQQ